MSVLLDVNNDKNNVNPGVNSTQGTVKAPQNQNVTVINTPGAYANQDAEDAKMQTLNEFAPNAAPIVKQAQANEGLKPADRDKLIAKLAEYGVTDPEVVDAIIDGIVSGLEMTEVDINRVMECLDFTLKTFKRVNEGKIENTNGVSTKFDAESIISFTKKLKIRTDNQWSIVGAAKDILTNSSQEGLQDRLTRFFSGELPEGFDFYAEENYEKVKELVIRYITFLKESDPKLGVQDFAKMLSNAKSDEERALFEHIIDEIQDDNEMLSFLKSYKYSFESDEKREKAMHIFGMHIHEHTKDRSGETTKRAAECVTCGMHKEHLKEVNAKHKEEADTFYNMNKIDELLEKPEEELTNEEREVLRIWKEKYESIYEGIILGTARNKIISKNDRDAILSDLNADLSNYGEDIYREVLESAYNYIKEHHDDFDLSLDDFIEIMDRATGGNFSVIAGDVENNTVSELDLSAGTNTEVASSSYDTVSGMFVVDDRYNEQNIEETQTKIKNNLTRMFNGNKNTRHQYGNVDLYLSSPETTIEDVNNYINNGGVAAITDILNSRCKGSIQQYAYEKALEKYEEMNASDQKRTISITTRSRSFSDLCKFTKKLSVLESVKDRVKSFYEKQIVETRVDRLREQQAC